MDNQCANICSTHATVYGLHSVKFAFIERENIFLHGFRFTLRIVRSNPFQVLPVWFPGSSYHWVISFSVVLHDMISLC